MEAVSQTAVDLGIKTVITSKAFMPHYMDYWPGDEAVFIDLRAVLSNPGQGIISMEQIRARFEPAWMANWRLDLKKRDPQREAIGLIPSPGDDAIFLSSQELHSNALQIASCNFVQQKEKILCETSMSRAAGILMGFWAPLLSGGTVVSRSLAQRENSEMLADLILHYDVSLISGTADFYKKITAPLNIDSLSHGVVFDSIHPVELEGYEETVQIQLCQAWESMGRVISMSCPDPNDDLTEIEKLQIGRKPRSVGRFLPGIAGKVVDGTLFIRFTPQKSEIEEDENDFWFEAGDDANIDEQSLVYRTDLNG